MEKNMHHVRNFKFPRISRGLSLAILAAVFAAPLLLGSATAYAQQKLTSAQQQTMSQCLIGCNKGDASCQNTCTNTNSSPAYFSAAGSCVRACADALVVPGQPQSQTDDLMKCVQACN
jgi:hypothetical protein